MTVVSEINVLVTGLGLQPYPDGTDGGRIDENTSYLVTTLLPRTLEPKTALNPSANRINIITLPHYVRSEYRYVRAFCRDLHQKHADDVDVFIHLGEARGWTWLTLERAAYKQGMSSNWWSAAEQSEYYTAADDVGQTIKDLEPCPWVRLPMGLRSALDIDAVADGASAILKSRYQFERAGVCDDRLDPRADDANAVVSDSGVQRRSPIDIRPHDEGGPYLCGFLNYESLANRYAKRRELNVLFCHIPGEADPANLSRTRDGILAITVAAANEVGRRRKK
ncbi:hypothetical protein JX266_013116 [Neoarthrinium moseri]|nr:hypothetical protein JX266_013116 [Neoarthrinium moseri]